MIVRTVQDAERTERRVVAANWESTRLLLRADAMGFSFHVTTIYPDTETRMCYRHHLEAVLCIEGDGTIEDLGTGAVHAVGPGTLYALDRHDRHVLRARTAMRMVCVFNPPLHGKEVHDETGAYPQEAEAIQAGGRDSHAGH